MWLINVLIKFYLDFKAKKDYAGQRIKDVKSKENRRCANGQAD